MAVRSLIFVRHVLCSQILLVECSVWYLNYMGSRKIGKQREHSCKRKLMRRIFYKSTFEIHYKRAVPYRRVPRTRLSFLKQNSTYSWTKWRLQRSISPPNIDSGTQFQMLIKIRTPFFKGKKILLWKNKFILDQRLFFENKSQFSDFCILLFKTRLICFRIWTSQYAWIYFFRIFAFLFFNPIIFWLLRVPGVWSVHKFFCFWSNAVPRNWKKEKLPFSNDTVFLQWQSKLFNRREI